MNALVLKDVSLLKSAILYIAVFGIIFCAVFNEGATMCVICAMLFASLISSTFSWDDQCQWNVFAVSAGIPRKAIVTSKFISSVIFILIGTVIGFIVTSAIWIATGQTDITLVAQTSVLGFVLAMTVCGISIATNYITGNSAKAQYVSIIILVISVAILVAASNIFAEIMGGNMTAVIGLLVLVMAVILAASYTVSCRRFQRWDL